MRPRQKALLAFLAIIAPIVGGTACTSVPAPPRLAIFYPSPPDSPRIQYLRSFSARGDIGPRRYGWVDILVGPPERDRDTFLKPYGVAVAAGEFYVCDTILGTVWVARFHTGEFHPIDGDQNQGKLKKPINVVVDNDDLKYVTDIERGQVVVFGAKDEYVTAFGEGPPFRPSGVAISGDRLIVSDIGKYEVQIRDKRTGKVIRSFGSPESSPVEEALGLPVNLAVDSHGNILVSDSGGYRVCVFSPEGKFLASFGRIGRQAGEFARPKGIATDRENRIYVVDSAFENAQVFDEAHRLLMWFGGHGKDEGALSLPAQVAVDYNNVDYFQKYVAPGREIEHVIWVTSQTGPRGISCYGFLRPSPGNEAPR